MQSTRLSTGQVSPKYSIKRANGRRAVHVSAMSHGSDPLLLRVARGEGALPCIRSAVVDNAVGDYYYY